MATLLHVVPTTVGEPLYGTLFSPQLVKCMDRDCSKCEIEKPVDDLFNGIDEDISVCYYQWSTSGDGRVMKHLVDCTVADAKEDLAVQLQQFQELKYL